MEQYDNKFIYMDYGATTFMKNEVINAMEPFNAKYYGNPSALYSISRKSKESIDTAREILANSIKCSRDEIYFTGGGSESDNWAIKGVALSNIKKGNHIITTSIEHHAVLNSCKYLEQHGWQVTYLNVDKYGKINVDDLKSHIKNNTVLVSIMFANNEIGTIQPIKEIGKICREKAVLFHTDAVQAAGHIPIDVREMNIDLLSIAAHKFYGPKGVGALYIKKGTKIDNLIHGGAQERDKRSGTENVAGIVGMGKAIEIATLNMDSEFNRLSNLRDRFIGKLIQIPKCSLNGTIGRERLPNNINVSFEGIEAETLLMILDQKGICASAGSACSAGALEPSHVLKAIGLSNELSIGTVRFTIGETTNEDEIDYVYNIVEKNVKRLRSL